MPVDRSMRDVIVRDLAALMRGKITPQQFMSDAQAQCEQTPPVDDVLIMCFWDDRLGPLPADILRMKRLEVSLQEYEHLRRWVTILQTDVDWNVEHELPKGGCVKEMLPPVLTIAAMIAAGVLFDGVLIIAWALIGLVVAPITMFAVVRRSREDASERDPNPFASVEDRDSVMHLVEAAGVPPFDERRHAISMRTKFRRFALVFPFAVLFFLPLFWAVWPFALWMLWHDDDDDVLERVPLPSADVGR